MTGYVDVLRRAVISITVRGPFGFCSLDAVVDTGFNGHLGIPEAVATQLGLVQYGRTFSRMADGRVGEAPTYLAELDWVNGPANCYAVATDLPHALIGTALLEGRVLTIDFGTAKTVEVR